MECLFPSASSVGFFCIECTVEMYQYKLSESVVWPFDFGLRPMRAGLHERRQRDRDVERLSQA